MPKEPVTSLEVARLAGVSRSAVSRVFTPGASASPKMVEQVMRAADQLGYRPNALARSLITGSSRIIGLVVNYLENQFYPEALSQLSDAMRAHGYHLLVFSRPGSADFADDVLEEILDYQVEAVVMASASMSSGLAERCRAAGVSVLLFNRRRDEPQFSSVTSDNIGGGRRIAEFLVAGGHRRIAYVAGYADASTQRDRENGFLEGLAAAGALLHARECGEFNFECATDAARRLLRLAEPPDAIFAANDHMAFAVMETARSEFGLRIPEDLSIVGYDDVPLAGWPSFSLTTVRQPLPDMVAATVEILLHQLATEDAPAQHAVLPSTLVIRSSSRCPPMEGAT